MPLPCMHSMKYDRRVENEATDFNAQRRMAFVVFLLFLVGGVTLLIQWITDLGQWQLIAGGVIVLSTMGMFMMVALLLLRVLNGRAALIDHITQTRTAIQTLQQLIEKVG